MNPPIRGSVGATIRFLRLRCVSLLVGLLAASSASSADSLPKKETITFKPDPEIQKAVDDFAHKIKTKHDFDTYLERLRKIGGKNIRKLVPNLVYYASREGGGGVREGMAPGVIIHYLRIGEDRVISALLPYVGAENVRFRKDVERLIKELEPGFRERPRSFKNISFREYAHLRKWPPRNVAEFLFRERPGITLQETARTYLKNESRAKTQPVYWAEYAVRHALALERLHFDDKVPQARRDAIDALRNVANHDAWWVRLYVAEILNQHPEFRTKDTVDRLKRDKDELVRQAISRKAGKHPKARVLRKNEPRPPEKSQ